MKNVKILAVIVVLALVACFAGCNGSNTGNSGITNSTSKIGSKESTSGTTTSNNTTSAMGYTSAGKEDGAMTYVFESYGYKITYPKEFTVLNEEGNMIEFKSDNDSDFTVLVLQNPYETVDEMIEGEAEEDWEIISQDEYGFLAYSDFNGKTAYTYYYFSHNMVMCELLYSDNIVSEMKDLEKLISVEEF